MGRSAHADKLVARSFAELCLGLLLQQRLGVLLGKRTARNHEGAEGVEHPTPGRLKAAVDEDGARHGLIDVLQGRMHTAGPRALLGKAHDDDVFETALMGDL